MVLPAAAFDVAVDREQESSLAACRFDRALLVYSLTLPEQHNGRARNGRKMRHKNRS
jgi:hypothetical protein